MDESKLAVALKQIEVARNYNAYLAVANALEMSDPEHLSLPEMRVAILRNFTLDPLLPVIKGEIARIGFYPSIYQSDYDAINPEVLNPKSQLFLSNPDFIILAQWLETLAPTLVTRFISLTPDQIQSENKRVVESIQQIIHAIRLNTKAPILVNNFPLPTYTTLGILDAQQEYSQTQSILNLNHLLQECVHQWKDVYIVDFFSLMARIGSTNGLDNRYWHMGRSPLGKHSLLPFGLEYGKFFSALRGKTFKCLALDCDNTLWGGVIGEDGISGIKLGTTYPGSCYRAFQQEILNLHDRGVILALCSKNNEEDALEVFRTHPDCVLREEHFAATQINWDDKVTNLKRLAKQLNIGIDSFVFVDDSEYECNMVREMLPQVAVVQLPNDPSAYTHTLSQRGFFDSLTFSIEDRERNQMYRDDVKRQQILETAPSLEEYLLSLNLVAEIGRPGEISIPRVAQLTQKTNQFNVTTRRYSEGEIRSFISDHNSDVFVLRLKDQISDMGLVGVAIIKYGTETAEIDSLLLSCRAIGRGAEDALLVYLLEEAAHRGCTQVNASFIPTKKNTLAKSFYQDQGFTLISETPDKKDYEFIIQENNKKYPHWIKVQSSNQGV